MIRAKINLLLQDLRKLLQMLIRAIARLAHVKSNSLDVEDRLAISNLKFLRNLHGLLLLMLHLVKIIALGFVMNVLLVQRSSSLMDGLYQ